MGVINIEAGPVGTVEPYWEESLFEIKAALDMVMEPVDYGWGKAVARLFALDVALLVVRGGSVHLPLLDRETLTDRLQEARRLVVDGRDGDLGHLQQALERYLGYPWSQPVRGILLAALNAMLPSPYRAAQATVGAGLRLAETGSLIELSATMRQRLRAGLEEASPLGEESRTLFALA